MKWNMIGSPGGLHSLSISVPHLSMGPHHRHRKILAIKILKVRCCGKTPVAVHMQCCTPRPHLKRPVAPTSINVTHQGFKNMGIPHPSSKPVFVTLLVFSGADIGRPFRKNERNIREKVFLPNPKIVNAVVDPKISLTIFTRISIEFRNFQITLTACCLKNNPPRILNPVMPKVLRSATKLFTPNGVKRLLDTCTLGFRKTLISYYI